MQGLRTLKRIKKTYLNQDSVVIRLKTEPDKLEHRTSNGETGPVTRSILVHFFSYHSLKGTDSYVTGIINRLVPSMRDTATVRADAERRVREYHTVFITRTVLNNSFNFKLCRVLGNGG